jgi:hypothetical protein
VEMSGHFAAALSTLAKLTTASNIIRFLSGKWINYPMRKRRDLSKQIREGFPFHVVIG